MENEMQIFNTETDNQDGPEIEDNVSQNSKKDISMEMIPTEVLLNNNFEKFMDDLRENIHKCKYRKVLEDIKEKEILFLEFKDRWKIIDLKIRCMLKIINKKFSKYGGSKIKGMETWLQRVDTEVDRWYESLLRNEKFDTNNTCFMEQFEICMRIVLEQCYNYALFARNEKHMADCAGFLALGERLIKYSSDFTNYPDVLNVSQRILLFTSSLLISDNDYETAKVYQENALRLCYKELYFRVDLDEGINFQALSPVEKHYLEKVFTNIVIGFYHLGVCEENLSNMTKAIEAYKQSRWFGNHFVKQSLPEIVQFLGDVEKRAYNYYNLITHVKTNQKNYKEISNSKKSSKSKLYFNELNNLKKYESTAVMIENMKIPELEDIDIFEKKSENVNKILSTMKLVNHMMSDKFKSLIKNMDKFEVSKLEKETREKIQRKINEIKAEKIFLEAENRRRPQTSNMNLNKKNKNLVTNSTNFQSPYSTVNDFNQYMNSTLNFSSKKNNPMAVSSNSDTNNFKVLSTDGSIPPPQTSKSTNRKKYFNIEINKDQQNEEQSERKKSARPYTCRVKNPLEVQKFNYSEFVFDNSFRKKVKFLDNLGNKEITFQKSLLKLKKSEKIYMENYDVRKTTHDCENFFHKVLSNKTSQIKEEDRNKKKEILNENFIKMEKEKEKLETKVIKSLDNKAFKQYTDFKAHMSKPQYYIRTEATRTFINMPQKEAIEKKNQNQLDKLEEEIHLLDRIIEHTQSSYRQGLARKESCVKRKKTNLINAKTDNFIKRK